MNKDIIQKILEIPGGNCPVFHYENPLLDKDVANLVAKSVVKLINDKKVHSKLKQQLLFYIRNTCKNEPANHLGIDDNITEILKDSYEDLFKDIINKNEDIGKTLDTFLIRTLKEVNISSIYMPSVKLEIIKALSNLKGSKNELLHNIIIKDVIYWKVDESNHYSDILKSLWNPDSYSGDKLKNDDISIKNKPEIEKVLLTCCKEVLETVIIDLEDWPWEREDLKRLVQMCAVSTDCFQMSCCILNDLFIKTNFDQEILRFIDIFVQSVKDVCKQVYFSLWYPANLRHIVVLLDINVNRLPPSVQESYTSNTMKYLHDLCNESENDLIMLLSHFQEWFDIYYNSLLGN